MVKLCQVPEKSIKKGTLWGYINYRTTVFTHISDPILSQSFSCLEGSTHTALLNRVESKAFCLNSPPLTDCLDYLSYWRNVASLSLFYRFVHADCSSQLANCMPPPLLRPRCTTLSTSSHPYSVHLSNASFIPYTGKLWNFLPLPVFPPVYDLNSFKRGVSRHL